MPDYLTKLKYPPGDGRLPSGATDLDGRFAGDVRDQEVHGDVLAVDVLVYHVPDGLGHHIGVKVGVVLEEHERRGETRVSCHRGAEQKDKCG